ncbi:uncharacterized protein LOC115230628 isoform X2 [Octopus sinensis]|uniref:Uncharacterized protein LOC115230628 isoform X2 n=1 Tax=Octopus sinensis TaxID=2607531 RepID=A0A7E6EJW8_9MOLL|nr:uncharacterized protein LOC115230628 isoform X2 [Octopus sinensis]
MDILKFYSYLFALCFCLTRPETLTRAQSSKIFKTEKVQLQKSATLYINFPNIERPVEWICKNYRYECDDKTCDNTIDFQVTQHGDNSTLQIQNVTNECLTWTFHDNNNNFGKFDLKTNDNGALNVSATLLIEIPNMKRPTVWKYNNYKYECDTTCANSPEYKVTQDGDISTFWIRNVIKERLTWKFEDDNLESSQFDLKMHSLARRESYNITQSEPVALGHNVILHIEVAEMTGIVFWKNDNGRYECNPTCYNYGNYEVTQVGSISTLLIRNVTKQDLTWRFCDLYLCSGNYTLVKKGEKTETTTTKDAETTTTKDAETIYYSSFAGDKTETTTTKDAETNGSENSLPTYAIVIICILGFVAIVIIAFVVIFKCKAFIKVKTSITQCVSGKKDQN